MLASNQLDLNIEQERKDETRNIFNFEDRDFPVLRHNFDRKTHAHHSIS